MEGEGEEGGGGGRRGGGGGMRGGGGPKERFLRLEPILFISTKKLVIIRN